MGNNNLNESQDFLQIIAANSSSWEMIFDPKEGYRYVTSGCRSVSGYTASDFLEDQDLLSKITHPDDKATVDRHFSEKRTLQEAVSNLEFRIRCKDGAEKWIEHRCKQLTNSDGELIGYMSSNYDITKRKQIEIENEQLIKAVGQWRDLFDCSEFVVFKWKNIPGWPVEYVSDNVQEVFGIGKDSILSPAFSYATLIHPDNMSKVLSEVEQASQNGKQYLTHAPYQLQLPDGTYAWVNDNTSIIRNEKEEITHYLGYVSRIDLQIEKDNKIKEREENFKRFFNSNFDLNFILDDNLTILTANDNALDLLGFDHRELATMTLSEISSSGSKELLLANANSDDKATDVTLYAHDGTKIYTECHLFSAVWQSKKAFFLTAKNVSNFVRSHFVRSQMLFKKAFDTSPLINFICEKETGKITEVNASFVSKLGISPGEALGQNAETLLGLELPPVFPEMENSELSSQWIEEEVLKGKGDTEITVVLSSELVATDIADFIFISAQDVSEQKKIESEFLTQQRKLEDLLQMRGAALQESVKELFQSENTYRSIIQNMQDVFYRTDNEGNITMISPSGLRLFGYSSASEMIGHNIADLIYRFPSERLKNLDLIKANGRVHELEIEAHDVDGNPLTLLADSQYFFDVDGNIEGIEGVLKDITSRKETEKALVQSEEKYRTLIEKSQDAIYLLYEDHFEHINPKFEELFGYTPEEVYQISFLNLVAASSKEDIERRIVQREQGKKPSSHYEFTAIDKYGKELEVEVSVAEIPFKNKYAVQGIIRDITHRKKSELQFKKLTERLRLATESAEIGVWEIEIAERKLYWDLQMYQLYECDPEDYSDSFEAMVVHLHPEDVGQVLEQLEKTLQTEERFQIEYRIFTKGKLKYLKAFAQISEGKSEGKSRLTGITYDISEAKRYELAIKEAEIQYRTVADFTYDWETWYSATGELLYCSPSCLRITGYSKEEYLNDPKKLLKIAHPEDRRIVERHFENITKADTEQRYSIEFRIFSKDGEVLWIGHDVQQVFDKDAKYLGIRGSSRDITRQKRNLEKLRQKTKQLATLNKISSEFAGFSSLKEVNAFVFHKMMALAHAELITYAVLENGYFKTTDSYVSPSGLSLININENRVFTIPRYVLIQIKTEPYVIFDNLQQAIECNLLSPKTVDQACGSIKNCSIILFPVFNLKKVKGLYSIFIKGKESIPKDSIEIITGITNQAAIVLQRIDANNKLLQSHKEWQEFISYANMPVFGVNLNGQITEWNHAAERITGHSIDVAQGKQLAKEFVFPMHAKVVELAISKAAAGAETSNLEFALKSKSGKRIIFLANFNARRNTEGEAVEIIALAQDITEIDTLRTQLKEERESLAKRVEIRTSALSLANAKLAKAAKLKDEFLANMSHELRTPLNSILGVTESMQEGIYGDITEKQLSKLKDVEEGGRHLLSLINEILDLAKIEAGKIELNYSQVNVEELCMTSLRFVKQVAFYKHIQVSQSILCPLDHFQADEKRIKQVLVNLLSNAVKFTHEAGQVGLRVYCDSIEKISFEVWDTGIGIKPEHMEKLFQPFEQIDSKLSRNYEGTGLGLALVKKLVALHNGSVAVDSTPGKGSRFTITLPVSHSIKATHPDEKKPEEIAEAISSEGEGKKILIAEDNEINILSLTEYLSAKNFRTLVVRNGIEAIDAVEDYLPDLILMDIQMPKMDGLTAMRNIRKKKNRQIAECPIIALTALAMPGDREKCINAGADAYMKKPISLKKLVTVINELLAE